MSKPTHTQRKKSERRRGKETGENIWRRRKLISRNKATEKQRGKQRVKLWHTYATYIPSL